jgi:hypothetical protein
MMLEYMTVKKGVGLIPIAGQIALVMFCDMDMPE